jgi:hypothetical protein
MDQEQHRRFALRDFMTLVAATAPPLVPLRVDGVPKRLEGSVDVTFGIAAFWLIAILGLLLLPPWPRCTASGDVRV